MGFRMSWVAGAIAIGGMIGMQAQAAVVNGGFETGDFTGWIVTGDAGWTGVDASAAHSGAYGAYFGEAVPGSSIAQTIATLAGATYQVEFWLQLDDSSTPNAFSWSWDGMEQQSLVDGAGFSYAHFSKSLTATSDTTTLQFNLLNAQSFYLLDDIAVSTAVPEPGSVALALLALTALGVTRRQRTASVA